VAALVRLSQARGVVVAPPRWMPACHAQQLSAAVKQVRCPSWAVQAGGAQLFSLQAAGEPDLCLSGSHTLSGGLIPHVGDHLRRKRCGRMYTWVLLDRYAACWR